MFGQLILFYLFLCFMFYLLAWLTQAFNIYWKKFQVNIKFIWKDKYIGLYSDKENHKYYISLFPTIIIIIDTKPDAIEMFLTNIMKEY
jgi:hypothetical protein